MAYTWVMKKLILVTMVSLSMAGVVRADLGPKPTMLINLTIDGQKVNDPIFNAQILSCYQEDENLDQELQERKIVPQLIAVKEYDSANKCFWRPSPFAWSTIEGGICKNSQCQFGYYLPTKFRLAVFIPSLNKVFISNDTVRNNFDSVFEARLTPNGISLIDKSVVLTEATPLSQNSLIKQIVNSLLITIILELLVALIYLSVEKLPKRILWSVLLGNFISLPLFWFVLKKLIMIEELEIYSTVFLFVLELAVVVFEAVFIKRFNKEITYYQSFGLSILMNLVSFFVGNLILFVMADIFNLVF